MDLLAPAKRFDSYQQRHRALSIPVAVLKKFGDDEAGNLAALFAYYAFFSLFPLLLVFVTILGFVLEGNPGAQRSIEHSVLGQFPIVGTQIKPHSLHGHPIVLVIGLVTSLLSGLGVTSAAQNALDTVWAVPNKDRPNFLQSRLRGLALLVLIGGLFVISTAASGAVSGGLGGPALKVAGIAASLLFNVALFAASFRLMTASEVPMRCLTVGVLVAAVMWEVLQIVGGYYIGHVVKHMSSTYANAGIVIGLLVFLHLGALVTLYAAEINVVIDRRLWPRNLFGPPNLRTADQPTGAGSSPGAKSTVRPPPDSRGTQPVEGYH
jgi:membrane protein